MKLHWLTVHLISVVFTVLEFLASPTGGRDIGRDILQRIGLRRGGKNGK